jgi:hypothetical protein
MSPSGDLLTRRMTSFRRGQHNKSVSSAKGQGNNEVLIPFGCGAITTSNITINNKDVNDVNPHDDGLLVLHGRSSSTMDGETQPRRIKRSQLNSIDGAQGLLT